MKKSIKIAAIVSIAILLIAWILLTIALFVTLDVNSDAYDDLYAELQSTKSQVEKYKRELDAYTPKTTDSFDSAEELINAIKHNPKFYNGKVVSVRGSIGNLSDSLILGNTGYWEGMGKTSFNSNLKRKPYIAVVISDDIQQSVVETGDRVRINGTVTIANGEIYLDNCEYTMIETFEEIMNRLG